MTSHITILCQRSSFAPAWLDAILCYPFGHGLVCFDRLLLTAHSSLIRKCNNSFTNNVYNIVT